MTTSRARKAPAQNTSLVAETDLAALGGHIAAFLVLIVARGRLRGQEFTPALLARRGRIRARHAQSGLAKLAALGMVERVSSPLTVPPVYRLTERGEGKSPAGAISDDAAKSILSKALAIKLGLSATSMRTREARGTESS